MFHVEQLRDEETIKGILLHDDIWPTLIPSCKTSKQSSRFCDTNMLFYGMFVSDELAGVMTFKPMREYFSDEPVYIVDVGIIKKFRGKTGYKLGKLTLNTFFDTVGCKALFCKIKHSNKPSLYFALAMGMRILKKFPTHSILGVIKNG